jgi:hypothetical protein
LRSKKFSIRRVDNANYYGKCAYSEKEITINENVPDERKLTAFYHEAIHAFHGPLARLGDEFAQYREHVMIEKLSPVLALISGYMQAVKFPCFMTTTGGNTRVTRSEISASSIRITDRKAFVTRLFRYFALLFKIRIPKETIRYALNLLMTYPGIPEDGSVLSVKRIIKEQEDV